MRQVLYLSKTSFCVVKHPKAQRLSDGLLTLAFAEMKTNDPISSGPMPWDSFVYLSDGEFEYKTVWEEDANKESSSSLHAMIKCVQLNK